MADKGGMLSPLPQGERRKKIAPPNGSVTLTTGGSASFRTSLQDESFDFAPFGTSGQAGRVAHHKRRGALRL